MKQPETFPPPLPTTDIGGASVPERRLLWWWWWRRTRKIGGERGKGESRDVTVKIYNTAGAQKRERGKMERKIRSGSGMGEKAE